MRALAAVAVLTACSSHASAPPTKTKLVVLVVVDQLPAWAFATKGPATDDGIARVIKEGRHWTARYPYAATQTAPGHAALGTGAPPAQTGIIANEWWDRGEARMVRATEDVSSPEPNANRLEVDGLADALARAHPSAKAVAVSLKDRSALLALGHSGLAVWYDDTCTCMRGSRDAGWVKDLPPIAPRVTDVWNAADPARLAKLSGSPDDAPGEISLEGWSASFPHDPAATGKPAHVVLDTPLGDQIVVEAAIGALGGEALGQDDVPDYLVVSFSAYDYINHAFGQDSWESWDAWLTLDHQLGDLERALDAEVGRGAWAMVLTSDHGAVELPERRAARGLPNARLSYDDVMAAAEQGADAAVPGGPWIASAFPPNLYLTDAARRLPDDQRAKVIDGALAGLRALPAIARAARREDLAVTDPDDATRAMALSIEPARSGEILYDPAEGTVLYKPGWKDAISHGSTHAYDREVPLLLIAPGVAPGDDPAIVSPLQVAPTIAALLGVPPPSEAHAAPLYGQPPATSR